MYIFTVAALNLYIIEECLYCYFGPNFIQKYNLLDSVNISHLCTVNIDQTKYNVIHYTLNHNFTLFILKIIIILIIFLEHTKVKLVLNKIPIVNYQCYQIS